MRILVVAVWLLPQLAVAFVVPRQRTLSTARFAGVYGIPLIGRFRKKKQVEQTEPISPGTSIPELDLVEAGSGDIVNLSEVLSGKSILIGTCTVEIHVESSCLLSF
jgi:hypothetical protein